MAREPAERAKRRTLVPRPSAPTRSETLRVARLILGRLTRRPGLPLGHLRAFARAWFEVVRGRSTIGPAVGDRRFADQAWQEGRVSRTLLQTYLLAAQEIYALIQELELQGRDAGSARFLATTLIEGLSPSNNPLLNPAVRDAVRRTRGRNLLRGLQNLLGDQLDNGGLISMVDRGAFEVGRNVAATPGDVVFRNEVLELIQYRPTTAQVHSCPLLIVPPQINKYYVLDLSPGNSLVRHLVGEGVQVFMVSWRNPRPEHREWGLERYCDALEQAHHAVMEITGSPKVNWKGLCAGGVTAAVTLGRYAAKGRLESVGSLTLNVTLLDIAEIENTQLGFFLAPEARKKARIESARVGVLDGAELAKMFAWIRPNDLVWNYWVNNYLMGEKPAPFDVLYWNSDATRLPAALHADFMDLVDHNPFGRGQAWPVGEVSVDLQKVDVDSFIVAGRTDHITPWEGCYRSVHALGGRAEFVLVNSGHIQTLVSPPGKGKASYQTASGTPATASDWLAVSAATPGSWWDHWVPWLKQRSGSTRPAPSTTGSAEFQVLGPAPGTYVKQ